MVGTKGEVDLLLGGVGVASQRRLLEGFGALKNQNKCTKVGSAHSKWPAWSELWLALRQNLSDRRALFSFTQV